MSTRTPKSSDELFRATVEQMHEGIQVIGRDWRYIYINRAAEIHGRLEKKDLIGNTMMECYPRIDETHMFKVLTSVMKDRIPQQMENYFEYPDGSHNWFQLYIDPHPQGILLRSMDITEKKKIEEQYQHSQKLEAIGQLAGGVAHDFNNKLGIMTIYCELALKNLDSKDPVHNYISKTQKAVQQAAQLTRQLLAFSRKQVLDLKVVNLNDLIYESQASLEKLLGEHVAFKIYASKNLGHVRVDPSQIDQVLLNLCINARDALSEDGIITVETQNIELDEDYCKSHPEVLPGQYVMLSVSDNGCGIGPEVRQKIFEPFFTTKTQGRGTGLGLSMVHGIVKQSSGHIWVYSEKHKGTVFKIYFPRVGDAKDELDENPVESLISKGDEGILLVEDEPHLREAFQEALRNAGYKVFSAGESETATKIFETHANEISLLLTDVVLPHRNGRELARELTTKDPDLRVVFVSGYTENSIVHHAILDTDSILIQKPVSTRQLLITIRKVLDGVLRKGLV